ncbi:DUF6082 family protein [Paractinoplanes rishiriensis]|uniref:Uncharacterized protein n=1 Tax=Paractinoplanes rishiriensis TaxID=1050105 RepID=A0A919K943_9ACTN|nr:DUF6082 family protein [Actinoplanes rishiriensis]GIF00978.1 hypothetical protein Ari01nite_84420 [Actinoplanes rishiriensis]
MVLAALGLIGSIFGFLSSASDKELSRYGNIGQSFDVIATFLSAIALIGVAASLIYQERQERQARVAAWLGAQGELLKMVIADPGRLGPCIIDTTPFASDEEVSQYFFSTLWLSFHRYGMELGYVTEEDVRGEVGRLMFQSETARHLWSIRKDIFEAQLGGLSPYLKMVEEEHPDFPSQPNIPRGDHKKTARTTES